MNGPVIETARLTLRPQAIEDFPRWAEMMADPEAAKFIGGPQPPEAAWRGFMTMAGAWSLTGVAMFSVIERETGLWLGRIGPWTPLGWPGTEVGWGLHPDAQGKGYGGTLSTNKVNANTEAFIDNSTADAGDSVTVTVGYSPSAPSVHFHGNLLALS